MKRIITLLVVALMALTTACSRRTIIPDEELAMIFRDAFLTNAYFEHKQLSADSLNLYAPIFERYGYTTEDVQLTIGNFSRRKSARLGDVVERAIVLLEEEGLRYDQQVVVLDTIREVALRRATRVVLEDSLIRVQSLRDTSRLHFTLPVEEGEYTVSFRTTVDSLDKNDRLQRRTWLQHKDGSKHSLQIMTLPRKREDKHSRIYRADSLTDSLHLRLVHFPDKPKRPDVTVRDLKITYKPNEREAIEQLYRQQLGIRIFADEFFRAALQNEQTIEKDSIQ